MYDSNLLLKQPSRPCTHHNSKHPPQRNGDALSDRREWDGGSSTSTEFLSSPCRVRVQQNRKKVIQINTYQKILSLKPLIKLSLLLDNNLFCYKFGNVTCNSLNVIYFITCSNSFKKYVRETVQQLNIRFATR